MKKVLSLVLAVVMIMSMAVSAAALDSPEATVADLTPILTQESNKIVELHTTEDVLELDEEIQKLMAEAKAKLKDACPEGFAVKYFFYVEILVAEESVTVEFEPIAHDEIVVMQYIDGVWTELELTVNEDGIITVEGVVEAPIAVLTK